jgi:integrase
MSASNFLNREFKRALSEAKLPKVTAHSLRHSFASILKSAGVASSVAYEIIGHSNFATTMKLYGSVSAEARINAATTVGDALRNDMDKHRTNN